MREVWLVDAFTEESFRSNSAGVVPSATGLSVEQMQAIANELYASETAFIFPPNHPDLADVRVRFLRHKVMHRFLLKMRQAQRCNFCYTSGQGKSNRRLPRRTS